MKNILIKCLLFSTLIISCNNKPLQEKQDIKSITPNLSNNDSYDFGSLSRKGEYDVVTKLFQEAIEKNEELENLTNRIDVLREKRREGEAPYSKYSRVNSQYWNATTNYIAQINDPALKESIKKLFDNKQTEYYKSVSEFDSKLENIEELNKKLNDQFLLMKLFVILTMINNYQTANKPALNDLEKLINNYNEAIRETNKFMENVK